MKIRLLMAILIVVSVSCNEKKEEALNEFTLKSTGLSGFLFETLRVINYPNSNNLMPDFGVFAQGTESGETIYPFLSHYEFKTKFYLIEKFVEFEIALERFETYELPSDYETYEFDTIAYMVQPNQIWLIKLKEEKFGIILTKSTYHNDDNNNAYAEVTFKARRIN